MMRVSGLVIGLLWMPLAWAAEPCTTVDVTGFSAEQRTFFWADVSAIARHHVVKANSTTGEICFADTTHPEWYPTLNAQALAALTPVNLSAITTAAIASKHAELQPARNVPPVPKPDAAGFLGDVIALYPTLPTALERSIVTILSGAWTAVEAEIIAKKTSGAITQAKYDAIKASVAARHIPITLP